MNNNIENDIKQCVRCGKSYPGTVEYFEKEKRSKDNLTGACKVCRRKVYKKRRQENKEKARASDKRYYEKNKVDITNKIKKYRQQNKDEVNASNKMYYAKNIEKMREQTRVRVQRRNAIKSTLQSDFTLKQWENLKKHFDNECAYCGNKKELEQEHFVPVSKKGEYTINNIIPSCRSCNASKFNHSFFEWYPTHKSYSKKRENKILEYLNYETNKEQQLSIF